MKEGDAVVCFAPSQIHGSGETSFVESVVHGVSKCSADKVIILTTGHEKIIAAEGQRFFDAKLIDWIDAEKVAAGDKLLSLNGEDIEVDFVEACIESYELYKVSVADYNNFFVTSKNLLVHNYADILYVAAAYVVESYPAVESAFETVVAVGSEFMARGGKSPQQNRQNQQSDGDGSGGAGPPEKEPDKGPVKVEPYEGKKCPFKTCDIERIVKNKEKREHIFGQEKHRFKEFGIREEDVGKQKAVFRETLEKVVEKGRKGEIVPSDKGIVKTVVDDVVDGRPIEFRGKIVEKDLKAGTAAIPGWVK